MNKKRVCMLLAGLMTVPVLTGNMMVFAEGEDLIEIRFAEWDGGDSLKVYEEVAEKFNEAHPDIHVTIMNIPDEYDTKITTMIAGGDIPEICEMESGTLLFPLADQGIILNMKRLRMH